MLDKWAQILVTCAVVTASLGLPVPAAHANEAPEPSKAQLLRDCEEGARLLEEKKLKDAEAYLRSAMDIDPPDYDAQLKYAQVLLDLGKYKEALTILQIIVAAKPEDAGAWATLGACYTSMSSMRSYAKASEAYGKALGLVRNQGAKQRIVSLMQSLMKEMGLLAVQEIEEKSEERDYYTEAIAVGFGRWSQKKPISVYISPGARSPGYKPEFTELLTGSFAEWTKVSAGKVRFGFVTDPATADISCFWTGDRRKVVNKAEAGHSSIKGGGEEGISKVNIVLLTDQPSPGESMSYNHFHKVALHEIGHAIGLFGHSPDRGDIMYPLLDDSPTQKKLSARDIATVVRLYTSPPPRPLAPRIQKPPESAATTGGPKPAAAAGIQKLPESAVTAGGPKPAAAAGAAQPAASVPEYVTKQAFEAVYTCTSPKVNYTARYVHDGKGNLLVESWGDKWKSQFMFFRSDGGTYFVDDNRKLALKTAGKESDFDAYIGGWNKHQPPTGATPIGQKVVSGHPSHGYSGKAGFIHGEVWIADDVGVPSATDSDKGGIQTHTELKSFKVLAPSEIPDIAVPYGYRVTTSAQYVDSY